MERMPVLQVVTVATRQNRAGPAVAEWFLHCARLHGKFNVDAFVFVTPEYNCGAPPSIVNAIDYLNKEWAYKPLGFVSYGGVSGERAPCR
jgi:hypothetical protein